MSKKKIVFLASGNGGNFHFIHEVIKRDYLTGFEIVELITDRKCAAQEIAKNCNIKYSKIDFSKNNQESLLNHLININPDLIITTVHKILSVHIIKAFEKKLINLHYSLLPSYSGLIGMRPIEKALKFGEKCIGVTTHFAEEEVDLGKQIAQIYFLNNNFKKLTNELENLVFRCGCLCLLAAIYDKPSNDETILDIMGTKCILKGSRLPSKYVAINDGLWSSIQHQMLKSFE